MSGTFQQHHHSPCLTRHCRSSVRPCTGKLLYSHYRAAEHVVWKPSRRAQIVNLLALITALSISVVGCSRLASKPSYTTVPNQPHNNSERAKKLNTEGLTLLGKGKIDEAETAFRDALAADVDYAPAHNNLGQIYLKRHQLYLAAWEFQFAANLMPGRAESLINLGLVYETGNRLPEARTAYESALEIEPANAIALGNLARVCVKLDDDPSRIHFLLSELVMQDSRPDWLKWAKDLLATRYQPSRWSNDADAANPDASNDPTFGTQNAQNSPGLRVGPIPQEPRKLEVVPPPFEVLPNTGAPAQPIPTPSSTPELPAPLPAKPSAAKPSAYELPVRRAPTLELSQRMQPPLQEIAGPPRPLNAQVPHSPITPGPLTARTIDLPPSSPVVSPPDINEPSQVQPAQYQTLPDLTMPGMPANAGLSAPLMRR